MPASATWAGAVGSRRPAPNTIFPLSQVDVHQVAAAAGPADPEALALWQGTLLPDLTGLDLSFDKWIDAQRVKLTQRTRTTAEAILSTARGPEAVTAAAKRLLAIDPVHEPAWRALIRAHADRGDRASAIATFERYSTSLSARSHLDCRAAIRGVSRSLA